MIKFKVFAGSMFVGLLTVVGDSYEFINRNEKLTNSIRISGYKNLNMERI